MRAFKKGLVLCLLLGLLTALGGCSRPQANIEPQGIAYFAYFDTVSYVYSYAGDSAEQFESCSADVASILETYHQLFDIYHEYSGINNLCTVNRLAGGEPVEVDEKLIAFLLYARSLYEQTDGEMNIMMGAVLRLWHNCRSAATDNPAAAALPLQSELEEAAQHIDFSLLEIDEQNNTVRIADASASIDVGALGKGYATEMAARHLEQQGITSYVLNIGGNIRIIGSKPDGSGWNTGIRDPFSDTGGQATTLVLADTACVTSGIYERYFVVDGERYHHVIDADTLWPSEYYASISIITKDSALADALSTALFCMSKEDGAEMAQRFGAEVVWILHDGTVEYTEGARQLLKK